MSDSTTDRTPILLSFHGSGSNATCFRVQLARLSRLLPELKFHTINAPFPGPAGPGVLPFFEGCGPYYHWAPLSERVTAAQGRQHMAKGRMTPEAERVILAAIREIHSSGGEIVGICGFSQGTRVASGLCRAQELRRKLKERRGKDLELTGNAAEWEKLDIRMCINLCGSYPPPILPFSTMDLVTEEERASGILEEKIRIPTVHVQGLSDEWAWSGKMMIEECFEEETSKVLEVDAGHQLPARLEENERLRDEILNVWDRVKGT